MVIAHLHQNANRTFSLAYCSVWSLHSDRLIGMQKNYRHGEMLINLYLESLGNKSENESQEAHESKMSYVAVYKKYFYNGDVL